MEIKLLLDKYEMQFYFLKKNNKWSAINEKQRKCLDIRNKKLIDALDYIYQSSIECKLNLGNIYYIGNIDLEYIITIMMMQLEKEC